MLTNAVPLFVLASEIAPVKAVLSTDAGASTVTAVVAVKLPSTVVAVIVAVPATTGVTTPPATVATFVSLDVQVTFLLVALAGATVAVMVPVAPPAVNVSVSGLTLIALTATVELPPSPPPEDAGGVLPPTVAGAVALVPFVPELPAGITVPPVPVTPVTPVDTGTTVFGVVTLDPSAPVFRVTVDTVPVPVTATVAEASTDLTTDPVSALMAVLSAELEIITLFMVD